MFLSCLEDTHIKSVVRKDWRVAWTATVQTQKPQEAEMAMPISKGQSSQRSTKTALRNSDMLIASAATGSAIWTVSLKWHSGILCLRRSPVCALASFPVSCALSKHVAFVQQQQQGKQTAGNNSFNSHLSYSRLRKTKLYGGCSYKVDLCIDCSTFCVCGGCVSVCGWVHVCMDGCSVCGEVYVCMHGCMCACEWVQCVCVWVQCVCAYVYGWGFVDGCMCMCVDGCKCV